MTVSWVDRSERLMVPSVADTSGEWLSEPEAAAGGQYAAQAPVQVDLPGESAAKA